MTHRLPALLTVLMLCALLGAQTAHAADVGITLDPTVVHLTMKPGELWRGRAAVTNTTAETVTLMPSTANMPYSDDAGAIALEEDITVRLGTVAAWVRPAFERLTVAPGERVVFDFNIQVPVNAPPGSHKGLIVLTKSPSQPQANAIAATSAVALGIDLTVVGQPNHHVALGDILVSPRFGTKPPVSVLASVVNTGNTLPVLRVFATVDRVFGGAVTVALAPDSGSDKVAPGSTGLWRGSWDGEGLIPVGLFRVHITAQDSSAAYGSTRWVLLLPWQVMVGVVVALAILANSRRLWFVSRRRRRR